MCKCSIAPSAGSLVVLIVLGSGILSAPGVSRADILTPWRDPVFDGDIENPWHVAISPTSPYAYVFVTSQWRGGALVALKRDAKGALVHKNVLRHSPDVVDGLREPNGVAISKDGKFLYVASAADSTVSVFSWNSASEKLAPIAGQVWKGSVPEWNVRGCFGVALSSDQKNLYVTGHDNDTLWIFAVQSDGKLVPKTVLRDGVGDLAGFHGPRCVAVTPDKDQVFVTAESSNTLFIFNRDLNTGALTLNKAWPNGKDGLTALVWPWWIDFAYRSPTSLGLNAYIACRGGGIVVLGRASKTKPWTVVEEHKDSPNEPGLLGCRYLALPLDGKRLYASAEESSSLTAYARDVATGGLTRVDQVGQGDSGLLHFVWPHQVIVVPDGKNAYVAAGDDALHCFTLRSPGKEIVPSSFKFGDTGQYQGLRNCEKIGAPPDGKNLYVPAAFHDNVVTCFERNTVYGTLTYLQTLGEYGDWQPPECLADVSQVLAPDNANVYACSRKYNAVVHFRRNTSDHGRLVFQRAYFNNRDGIVNMIRPSGMIVSPGSKKFLYVTVEYSNSVVWFEVRTDGSLAFKGSLVNSAAVENRLFLPSNLCFSPNDSTGKFLYVTAMGGNAILVFSKHPTSGALTYVDCKVNGKDGVRGLNGPLCIAIPADGKHLYIAALGESYVACFARDAGTGKLTFSNTFAAFPGCGVSMTFDRTGVYLYVPFQNSDTVAVFKRDTKTGALTLVEKKENGVPPAGVEGLAGPRSVAIVDNNASYKHLYVGCAEDDCVRIFKVGQ